jgi:putative transposase
MSRYRRGAHTIFEIKYHLVWVTKYRYRVLKGEVAYRARELDRQTCLSLDVRIEKGHVSKDHVHILVSSPPTVSPSKLMKRVKGRSSRKLQQEFAHLRKRQEGKALLGAGIFLRGRTRPGH